MHQVSVEARQALELEWLDDADVDIALRLYSGDSIALSQTRQEVSTPCHKRITRNQDVDN